MMSLSASSVPNALPSKVLTTQATWLWEHLHISWLSLCPYKYAPTSLACSLIETFPNVYSIKINQPVCVILQLMVTKRHNVVAAIPSMQSSPEEANSVYLSVGSLWLWQAGCQRQWWGRQSSPAAGWSWRRLSLRCRAANRNQQCPSPSGRCWAAAGSQCRTKGGAGSPPGQAGWQPQWQPREKGKFGKIRGRWPQCQIDYSHIRMASPVGKCLKKMNCWSSVIYLRVLWVFFSVFVPSGLGLLLKRVLGV